MAAHMKSQLTIAFVFLTGIVLCQSGCDRSSSSMQAEFDRSPFGEAQLVHDFGTVLEGEQVEYDFTLTNRLKSRVAIVDGDIQLTCGCTSLVPSRRVLEPDATATVRMRVDTTGKSGRMRVGGTILWRNNGKSWPVNLYLEGIANTILTTNPGIVQFSPEDASNKNCKELRVSNSVSVDWSSLCIDIEPPYAEVVQRAVHADYVSLFLRPCAPADALDFSATVQIAVDLSGGTKRAAVSVPLQGRQHVDVQVSPRVVFASWSPNTNRAVANFLLRHLGSDGTRTISSISCDGFATTWESKDIGGAPTSYRTLRIEMRLAKVSEASLDAGLSRRARVAFSDGQSVEVPLYLVVNPKEG
jgi:hypothetical protein